MIIRTVDSTALDGEQDYQCSLFATMVVVETLIVKENKAIEHIQINYVLFETSL